MMDRFVKRGKREKVGTKMRKQKGKKLVSVI